MAAQAFFYNAIFFTYALVLTGFYQHAARPDRLVHPAVRRRQRARAGAARPAVRHHRPPADDRLTYGASGVLLAATAYLFSDGLLSASTLTVAWMIVFFFASAAASSAYLTVSELFPLEMRALAIAFFYAVGTGVGGVIGPLLLGALISTGSRANVAIGCFIGAALMIGAAAVEALWGVAAERKPLEEVSRPLSFVDS